MNSICPQADKQKSLRTTKKKCKIEFLILDGADHNEACPECGAAPYNEDDEEEQPIPPPSCESTADRNLDADRSTNTV